MTNLTNGDDTYNGTGGDDIVNGRGGNDTINGLGGDDQINGGSGNDRIDGGQGDDQLNGGSDDDTLIGGIGNDIMIGGSGIDTVVINANGAAGIGSANGGVLTVLTADGQDQLSGIEFIQFNNGTVAVVNGNAQAYLGADTASISQQGFASGSASANDFDIDDTMTITGIHSNNTNTDGSLGSSLTGGYGTLTLNADGSYSYAADNSTNSLGAGESAVDTFTYTVHSGGQDYTQTITITINGTNDSPDITSSASTPSYTDTQFNDSFSNYSSTLSASDVDAHDTLTYGITGASADGSQGGYNFSKAGTYGTLYINTSTGAYIYIPSDAAVEAAKTTVHDIFTFTVSDGHGGSDTQSFDVTINGVNDKPTLGAVSSMTYTDTSADDTFTTQSGSLSGADRDNDTLSYHATGEGTDNSQAGFDHAVAGTYGTLYFNAATGAYEYVPNDGAIEGLKTTVSETFSFSASDGSLSSTQQTLTITLNGVNDTPVVTAGSVSNQLTEAGGVANGTSGTASASATMSLSDRDTGDTPTFDTSALTTNGWSTSDAGLTYHITGTYGTATLNIATGVVSYALNNNDSDTQGLQNSQTVHDIFTVYGTDGTAGSSTTVDFTINGANDAAIISGTISGSATEASGVANGTAGSAASGTATDTDVDNATNTFQAVGTPQTSDNGYGSWTVDAAGHWSFAVNEANATVQALNVGASVTDTFTIHTADNTAQVITVTIYGANDAAVVSGTSTDSVTESGGALFSGDPTAGGHLTDTDVDNTANLFTASSGTADHGYGSYTMNASGDWTFTLNNNNTTVQALNDGDTLQETFTITTADGTQQTITVTINGHNEVFSGTGGDDLMAGTVYGDTMSGGQGNDLYRVNNTHDVVVEASDQGEDTVQATVDFTLGANVEDLIQSGHADISGTGNALNNLISGNSGNNVLLGLGGDDLIRGGGGNDSVEGGDGDDNLDGGLGSDTASYAHASGPVHVSLAITSYQDTGGAGFDKLANFENLTGSGFDDTLTGNSGRNVITGGGGADTLTGGALGDTFVYGSISDSTVAHSDTITDLVNADTIDLSAIDADINTGGDQAFHIVANFTHAAGEMTLKYAGGVTTISMDVDGDGNADMAILLTGDHHTYTGFVY